MAAVEAHEQDLLRRMLDGLQGVTLYGKAARRTATVYFNVPGHAPEEVARRLAARKVNVWNGHNYAWEVTGALGIRDSGSAVRAGVVHYNVVHYNNAEAVDRLVDTVREITQL